MYCVGLLRDQIHQVLRVYYCHHQLLLSSFIHLTLSDSLFKLNEFYSNLGEFSYLLCTDVAGMGVCDKLICSMSGTGQNRNNLS